jgi:hypothetical protein
LKRRVHSQIDVAIGDQTILASSTRHSLVIVIVSYLYMYILVIVIVSYLYMYILVIIIVSYLYMYKYQHSLVIVYTY